MKSIAHRAGILYFLFMLIAIAGEFLLPSFVVSGDAAATAAKIAAGERMYRLNLLTGFATLLLHLFLVMTLYELFRSVAGAQARLMVVFVCVGVAIALANLTVKLAPLILVSAPAYLSVFSKAQLAALALGCLRLHSSAAAVVLAFWGLWLFPFGAAVIASRYFPRILGILLWIAGAAYLAMSIISIGFPELRPVVGRFMMPLYFGEVPIIFWLLIKGASEHPVPVR